LISKKLGDLTSKAFTAMIVFCGKGLYFFADIVQKFI